MVLMKEMAGRFADAVDALQYALTPGDVAGLEDDGLLLALGEVEQLARRVDALRVAASAEIFERSRPSLGGERLSARKGCRTAYELIARVTRVAESTAVRWCRLGTGIRERDSFTGDLLPPKYPIVAEALCGGAIGVDTAAVIVSLLGAVAHRAHPVLLDEAERSLISSALGFDAETGEQTTPFTADQTRIQATQWQAVLDPDGVKVREDQAMLGRSIVKTGVRGGLVTYRMRLMPETSGRLDRIFDSCLSPKTSGTFLTEEQRALAEITGDSRSPAQQRHDILAAALDAAARSAELPTIGGSSPTVLVSVDAEALRSGTGAAWIDGVDEPISMDAAKQFICSGGVQKAFFAPNGRLIALGSHERGFTPQQRRALTVRDAGCIVPGCTIPAGWTEIHHVREHAQGGPTHTDNGVMLCWFHHRTIDSSGWQVQMVSGVPYVRPPIWIDQDRTWRRASKSRARGAVQGMKARRQPSRT